MKKDSGGFRARFKCFVKKYFYGLLVYFPPAGSERNDWFYGKSGWRAV